MLRRALSTIVTMTFVVFSTCSPLFAQTQDATNAVVVSGVIASPGQQGIAGAAVAISGPVNQSTLTDANGSFSFNAVPPGIYRINVPKASFVPIQSEVVVSPDTQTKINLQLSAASFSSINEIGRVATRSSAQSPLNISTSSVSTMSGSSFVEQGQLNVIRALNEQPGFTMGTLDNGNFGGQTAASPLLGGVPQIRGALPYETASLIDGHSINLGVDGSFNPIFINPNILQTVEVVKGPGAVATNINYAIGGTVNFRTLEPTSKPQMSADFGIDQFGGTNTNLRATGTYGKFAYALDYASQGTQGPDRGYAPLDPVVYMAPGATTVNGQVVCGNKAANPAYCGLGFGSGPPQVFASAAFTTPLVVCCTPIPLYSNSRNELGKLRWNFTPSTSLTATYLGGQVRGSSQAADLYGFFDTGAPYQDPYTFQPPPGYSGKYAAGTFTPVDSQGNGEMPTNANMFSAEFRTALGPVSLNARYYSADIVASFIEDANPILNYGLLYGGVPLGNSTTPTIFTGQPGLIVTPPALYGGITYDRLGGYTVQLSVPAGSNYFSLSYDAVQTRSSELSLGSIYSQELVFPGSGQHFQTIAATAQLQLFRGFQATISNYATTYTDHYTQDFGATFQDSTHAYDVPRLGLLWHPTPDLAVRAAAGYSVAPPYLALLTNTAPTPGNQYPTTYFTETGNSGDIRPETAFGWDLGVDRRLGRSLTVSADVYQTLVRDQFLTTVLPSPQQENLVNGLVAYGIAPGTYPIYVSKTQNLGHSQYKGVELSIDYAPRFGFGFKVNGSLMRAYTYDLPAGFYDSAAGPLTTNLGVLPDINFQANQLGQIGGLSQSRVPYSQGYAELNWTGRNGARFLAGVTYYGNNNAYNNPPFGVVNASYRQPLGKHDSLLLSVANLTNAYPSIAQFLTTGLPSPLANGMLAANNGNVVGPSTASLTWHISF